MPSVVITGSTGRLGREFLRQFAQNGWTVHATAEEWDTDTPAGEPMSNVRRIRMNVTDFDSVAKVARAMDEPVDLLLGTAAYHVDLDRRFGTTDFAAMLRMFEVNALASLHLAEAFAPLVERSHHRKMVFLSARQGSMGLNVTGGAYGYRASKAALNAIVKSMAVDLLDRQIAILALHPGFVNPKDDRSILTPTESVERMIDVILRYNLYETGSFLDYKDQVLPW